MQASLNEIVQYRELLMVWTWRGIRARYKQTALGGLWSIIQPVSLMIVFTIIFSRFIRIDTGDTPYAVFSYTALLPWTLFATSISTAIPSLVDNMHLVTKVYFPREIFVLAAVGGRLFDFAIASLVFVGLAIYYQISITWYWLWIVPLLLLLIVLIVGISLVGAAVNVFYRDVRQAIVLVVQLWMYATPVIYPITMVPDRFRFIYGLNPMVGIIESFRNVILYAQAPPMDLLLQAAVTSVVLLFLSYWFFKSVEWQFGDII